MINNAILQILIFTPLIGLVGCSGTPPKLGLNQGQLTGCGPKPNCVGSQGNDLEHSIAPIAVVQPTEEVVNKLITVLNAQKKARIVQHEGQYIRAEFTSSLFGFVDDVEFLVIENDPMSTIIHVRSGSRIGYSDLGVNRDRIELIREKFNTP